MMKGCLTIFFLLILWTASAQQINLSFVPVQADSIESYELTECKFYVGHLTFFNEGTIVFSDDEYHLLDLVRGNRSIPVLAKKAFSFDSIAFEIGVDSAHHVAGILEGALDPSKGMYWSWQSGYINFKVEATNANKADFIYHLGGYMFPYACNQIVGFAADGTDIDIAFWVGEYLDHVSAEFPSKVMSPGRATLDLSKALVPYFRLVE